jgi:cytochrome b
MVNPSNRWDHMGSSSIQLARRSVYDLALRLLHAAIGASSLGALASGLALDFLDWGGERHAGVELHVLAGKCLIVSLVGRIVWGLVGPRAARLSDLWRPREWLALLRTRRPSDCPTTFGHDTAGSLAYVAFYIASVACGISGLLLMAAKHLTGPFKGWALDDVAIELWATWFHVAGYVAIAVFVIAHVGALVIHERHWGIPLAQAMFSGFQYRPVDDDRENSSKPAEEVRSQ